MEIKRFGDKFIVELCQKKFELYWSRKFKFGENFIERFCERITEKELNLLEEVIGIVNTNIDMRDDWIAQHRDATQEEINAHAPQPSNEEKAKINTMLGTASRIIFMQTYSYFKHLPVEDLKSFIDACYPLTYKTAMKQLEKFYNERYNGVECELERKVNDATCMEDWIVTRQMVSRFVSNDITELFKFAITKRGQKYITDALSGKFKTQLPFNSFFLQLFQETPYFGGLDKRNVEPKLKEEYINKIVGIYQEISAFEDLKNTEFKTDFPSDMKQEILTGKFNYADIDNDIHLQDVLDILWLSARKHINLLKTEKEINRMGDLVKLVEAMYRALPRRKLTNRLEFYTQSDEERRNSVLGFFAYWDAHMPDDLNVIKEEKDLKEQIEKQKQENIDKADLEHVGKTQAQINAERESAGELTMELKDQNGRVVNETKLT